MMCVRCDSCGAVRRDVRAVTVVELSVVMCVRCDSCGAVRCDVCAL